MEGCMSGWNDNGREERRVVYIIRRGRGCYAIHTDGLRLGLGVYIFGLGLVYFYTRLELDIMIGVWHGIALEFGCLLLVLYMALN